MNKKYLLPIAGLLLALLLVLLLVFPMLSMKSKDIPVGIISLDEGVTTPSGVMNVGDKLLEGMVKNSNKVLNIKKVKSLKDLDNDLDKGKFYATIIIPKDYSVKSISGEGVINVTINEGLNPIVTMQLSNIFKVMGEKASINFDIKSINSIQKYGFTAMLLPMMLIMMTFITSLVTSFIITNCIDDKKKYLKYFKQLIYIIIMSFVIGFVVSSIAIGISGTSIEIVKIALYMSIISLALMLLVNGCVSLIGKKGIVIPMLLFILGMGLVQLPYEFLNSTWQVLVASWEPFRYFGIGLREVLYQGHGIINQSFIAVVIVSIVGISFSIINIVKKEK